MQWLVIGLLVSLVALLIAAAGLARHIWRHHTQLSSAEPAEIVESPDGTDLES